MNSHYDIHIDEIERHDAHDLEYSKLKLNFSGKDVNEILVNTLRRVTLNNIPTYAFTPECIVIEKNTSVFNNDQMRVHLMQLPIFDTQCDTYYLEDKYWLNVNYASIERERVQNEKNIELFINITNNDDKIKMVTTNDIDYFEEHNKIQNKYSEKYPILLLKLRPLETFKCKMKAVIGIGERNAIWSGAGNAFFNINDDKSIDFKIESNGQISEYELLWKACKYLQLRFNDIKRIVLEKFNEIITRKIELQSVEIVIDNESHTIGNILAHTLQDSPEVEYAGTGKKNELLKQITIRVTYKKLLERPIEPIISAIDKIIDEMKYIEHLVTKLGKKYIHPSVSIEEKVKSKETKSDKNEQKESKTKKTKSDEANETKMTNKSNKANE